VRAAARFSNCPPQLIQYPEGGQSDVLADFSLSLGNQRGDVPASHIGGHDDPALAVLARDLVWTLREREGRNLL
jgi:hypothetical protein